MPNWCSNYVEVTGNPETIKKYGLLDEFSLQAIRPMPRELEGTTAPGDSPNWYDWCLTNWGTKWDVDNHGEDGVIQPPTSSDDVLTVVYSFSSAWSPPIEIYRYMERSLDLKVDAMYYEPGMAFYGTWSPEEGEITVSYFDIVEIPEDICKTFGIYELYEDE